MSGGCRVGMGETRKEIRSGGDSVLEIEETHHLILFRQASSCGSAPGHMDEIAPQKLPI